jgi:hypothetical protein
MVAFVCFVKNKSKIALIYRMENIITIQGQN